MHEPRSPRSCSELACKPVEHQRTEPQSSVVERFRFPLEAVPTGMILINPAGRIALVNAQVEKLFGYDRTELVGQTLELLVLEDLRPNHARLQNTFIEVGKAGPMGGGRDLYGRRKDGTEVAVEIGLSPVNTAEGTFTLSSVVDITERKRIEAGLRESEERFRLAMANAASGLYTVDLEGKVTYVNPAAETMFGWTNEELLGKKIHDVTHYKRPDGTPFPASECPGLQVLEKGVELHECQDSFVHKDGSLFPVVFSASPLKEHDQTVGIVVGFRDDTPRQEAERAVRESEERFRVVANTAPVMIWMSSPDKLCVYFNQRWLDFTGRPLESELGNGWAAGVHAEDLQRCLNTYTKAFDQRKPFEMEYRLRRRDDEYRWVLDTGVPRFNADGSFAGYIGSCIDITERKAAEAVIGSLSGRLIDAQEKERSRIGRELHDDIAQRLALLTVTLDGIRERATGSAPELEEELSQVHAQTGDLASDVQALSHRLHSSKLEVVGLVASAITFCRELSNRQNVNIHLHSQSVPADLPTDISMCLYRVLQEAVQNAVKHSGSHDIEVLLTGGPSEVELTVHDSGIGFEPVDAVKGRGIGLVSMNERLKLVHGRLSIDSQPRRGTTIHARVPLRQSSRVAAAGTAI